MLSVDGALARILVEVPRTGTERVVLADAHGRLLAEDVLATRHVPPWDNSAMDGFALRAEDTGEDGALLRVNEVVAAGGVAALAVQSGTATAIMTGAPVPPGADAVVMVERTLREADGRVRIQGRVHAGDHVRRRGEDVAAGDRVLEAGSWLTPARVGLAASLGFATLPVARRPVVAVLSTGDELVDPGKELGPGQIYSSNNATLCGAVLEAGAVPRDLGHAPDRLEATVEQLTAALEADVVLTTGGVSVGDFDFVKEAYQKLGVAMDFWKVSMKPGKPLAFGRVVRDGRVVPLFGLPGNPVSCAVNFLQFVRPWLLTAMGAKRCFLPVVQARMRRDYRESAGRARFVRVLLTEESGTLWCEPTGSQSSGVLRGVAAAHGFLLLDEPVPSVAAGETVRVQLLDPSFLDRSDPGYGFARTS